MLKTKTEHKQLTGQREKLEKELVKVRDQVIEKSRELGVLVAGDGDGSDAKITRLETALSKLKAREKSIILGLDANRAGIEKSRDQVNQEDFKVDQVEFKRISKRLNEAALGYISDFYKTRDDLTELAVLYQRGRSLAKKHNGKIATVDFTKSGQVIGVLRSTVVPVSRSIEIFAADLVEQAGERRRF